MSFSILTGPIVSNPLRTLTRSVRVLEYDGCPRKMLTFRQLALTPFARAMHIQSIPMCTFFSALFSLRFCFFDDIVLIESAGTGSSDNYAYLVVDDKSKDAVIIDPANPDECVYNGHKRWQS